MKKLSKSDTEKEIKKFFEDIENKSPKEIKKIKKLAMRYNVPLGNFRKKFCKKCFNPFDNSKIRIKKGVKEITCNHCGAVNKWKIKTS